MKTITTRCRRCGAAFPPTPEIVDWCCEDLSCLLPRTGGAPAVPGVRPGLEGNIEIVVLPVSHGRRAMTQMGKCRLSPLRSF